MAKDAKVFVYGREAKLKDLPKDSQVSLKLMGGQKEAGVIQVTGPAVHGILKSVDATKNSVTVMVFSKTKAAEEKNAENMLVIRGAPELIKAYEATLRLHAGHAHPYQRQTVVGSSGGSPATVSGNDEVHGNKHSKIYCLPSCSGYADMNPASVVAFASEAEAEHAGYRKAKNCR